MEGLISILIPCRNEENYIRACLESVRAFDLPAGTQMEVLVLDGRSTDRTRYLAAEISAQDPRVSLVDNPGQIQSCALNLGVARARGQWVMRLDAHTFYAPDYLRCCVETAQRTGAANVGGVCITLPGGDNYQARLVQALTTHKFGVGNSGFRTGAAEGPADTVPFGFFRRDLFDQIGFFDERLVRAQDYEFNRRIRAAGLAVWLNPAISCQYHNQPTLRAFYRKQFIHEAPYNAYLWYLAPYAFALRHAITGAFAFGVISGALLAPVSPWLAWTYFGVLALYLALALGAAGQQAVRYRDIRHVFALPPTFFLYHFLHGVGVLHGLIRIATGTAPVQRAGSPWPGAPWSRIPIHSLPLAHPLPPVS